MFTGVILGVQLKVGLLKLAQMKPQLFDLVSAKAALVLAGLLMLVFHLRFGWQQLSPRLVQLSAGFNELLLHREVLLLEKLLLHFNSLEVALKKLSFVFESFQICPKLVFLLQRLS